MLLRIICSTFAMRPSLAPYASALAVLNVLLSFEDASASQVQVDLSSYLNNKAAALDGYMASFDGHNDSYPAEYLPTGFIVDASINVWPFPPLFSQKSKLRSSN